MVENVRNQPRGNSTSSAGGTGPSMEEIVGILRTRIVSHDLPPGSKLREAVLTEEFKVSRPRIREAFGVLEDRGLIERIPNRGAVVTRLEADEVFALFEVREVLEALAVRLATEKADPGSWVDLAERFGKSAEDALARGDLDFYVDCVSLFRERAITAAHNIILAEQMESLYDRTKVLIRRLVLVPGRAVEGLRQHQEILQAMAAGNAELAERLKRANIRSSRDSFSHYQKYLL
ncbi:GntR family transcriptional regulator [Pusillimonas sp. T7-7]|uniref:GntR family transcriptional regulator n=1 Tax=Pusillimonas sp. (strain T7-7) TaxID=1007105 RepID=UPI00020847AC|nr:GntR family transcriptional regulator [Pusillimonas sp. T7-7]AEC21572.1 GntR family transcriptional regulator [Pusillimonas sp. T7-7]